MATDIAFAVAILALLGKRAPSSLQLFLLTFAIADDVGSILVIAIYYTAHFSPSAMAVAGAVLGLMLAMRWLGFRSPLAYLLPAVLFWVAMLKSGVHATIAGVILGAITPAKSLGRTSTFVETVWDLLPDMRDALDGEESDATRSSSDASKSWPARRNRRWNAWRAWFIRGRVMWCCPSSP
jgi:NhaA family Na+:H+ antiporter